MAKQEPKRRVTDDLLFGRTADKHLIRVNNWMELTAQRDTIVRSKEFVETSAAADIVTVARIVAETCKIGVVFGPAQIGKSFTLRAIEGQQRFGAPVLIRVVQFNLRPTALFRALCEKFELSSNGAGDRLFARLVKRLVGTHRMLIFDEAERESEHLPRQLSFTAAMQSIAASWMLNTLSDDSLAASLIEVKLENLRGHVVGKRPGRVEPRAVKRRPKPHALLTVPRDQGRAELLAGKSP